MKITKLGHCCLLIEEQGVRILTDPGTYSTAQNDVKNIDFVLITHEHADHFHVESLAIVLKNNPTAKVITNNAVGKLLSQKNIPFEIVTHKMTKDLSGVQLEGIGEKHADNYKTLPIVENTGYFIANKLFYPGDALTLPHKKVYILALPMVGPWMKFSEAIDYAKTIKPTFFFGVHEAILKDGEFAKRLIQLAGKLLAEDNIQLAPIEIGKETEL